MIGKIKFYHPLVALLIVLGACASGTRSHHSVNEGLPGELPKELRDKFEVVDPGSNHGHAGRSSRFGVARHSRAYRKRDRNPAGMAYPFRRPAKDPIWVSEKQVYGMSYFGVLAGEFSLEVMPFKIIGNRRVYHIRGHALSSPVFSLIYRLNDTVESFVDYDGSFSHRFHIVLDESKQQRDALELHDSEKKQTFYWNRWHPHDSSFRESKEFTPIEAFSQDILSSLYYLRTVPLPTGTVVAFPVVSEGKNWEAICTVVRREMMNTPMGRVQTVVLKLETKFQGVTRHNDNFLWLTDDDRKMPIRLEAKVKVGTVVANLKKFEMGTPPSSEGRLTDTQSRHQFSSTEPTPEL